jgi:hypothetical protein
VVVAKDIYATARKEGWSSEQVKEMLAKPQAYENYIRKVRSTSHSNSYSNEILLETKHANAVVQTGQVYQLCPLVAMLGS